VRPRDVSWLTPAPVLTVLIAGGLIGQVYLAGLAVFGTSSGWAAHGMFGGFLGIPIIGLACYSWLGSAGMGYRRPASLLLLLYMLQVGFVVAGMETGTAWIAAFHPANALMMLIAALGVVRRSGLPQLKTEL